MNKKEKDICRVGSRTEQRIFIPSHLSIIVVVIVGLSWVCCHGGSNSIEKMVLVLL